MAPALLALAALAAARATALGAQAAPPLDSARALDRIVVTAERSPTKLGLTPSSVTRMDGVALTSAPHATIADLLRTIPGFAVVDFDGLGFDPQLIVRGFYGGGEAEYVVVLVDGRPVNQLQTGLVAWDALPNAASVEAIEIVRGSASAIYGDAAVGAVMNIITRPAASRTPAHWSLAGGSHGSWRADADVAAVVARRAASLSAGIDRTGGARQHAERTSGRARVSLDLIRSAAARLGLSVASHWRDFEEPGPLLERLLDLDRTASDPLFRFDRTRDRDHSLSLTGDRALGARARLAASTAGEYRHTRAVRTLALAPGFGDTKERDATVRRASGSVQIDLGDIPLPGDDRLLVGVDASHGWLDSRYYRVGGGDRDAYLGSEGARDGLDASGDASREALALFAQYSLEPSRAVRLSLGARYDRLRDVFEPRPSAGAGIRARHTAVSPKAGVSVRYLQGERAAGSVYLTASRSFKAPTLDQLFDQRSIPVPFPPFSVTTSNAGLDPQFGASFEVGLQHETAVGVGARLGATLGAYHMDMKDELDFDLQTLRYLNIARSRHRGVEAGVTLSNARAGSLFATYTLQAATSRTGELEGNQLKAIPKHAVTTGAAVTPERGLRGRLALSHSRGAYLDDDNALRLPAHTRVDMAVGYGSHLAEVFVEARNVFDARYSSTGFLDPAGSGEAYFYPAAGRVITIGVRSTAVMPSGAAAARRRSRGMTQDPSHARALR